LKVRCGPDPVEALERKKALNNDPALLIEAMLSEEDDIFNTLLCRTARCATDVWKTPIRDPLDKPRQ
jgi:hypothetical protein